jgi:CTP synthase (UTP-ammonia lyase)
VRLLPRGHDETSLADLSCSIAHAGHRRKRGGIVVVCRQRHRYEIASELRRNVGQKLFRLGADSLQVVRELVLACGNRLAFHLLFDDDPSA